MSNDKIVERIKKLLTLGLSDPDSPECKSAMEKAGELMAQHNIDSVDIEEKQEHSQMVEEFVEVFTKETDKWERYLGGHIAKCFDCKMITISSTHGLPTRAFLGTKIDVELATFFYKFTRMQIRRRGDDKYSRADDRVTYCFGCAIRVSDRFDEMYGKRQEVIKKAGSTDLIVLKDGQLQTFVNEKYPKLKHKKLNTNLKGDQNAFLSGMLDGDKISINRQVQGGSKKSTTRMID